MALSRLIVTSLIGRWGVEGTDEGLSRIVMPHELPRATKGASPSAVAQAAAELAQYFAGARQTFSPKLAPVEATAFQRDCWRALLEIPYGDVLTYGDVALAIGRPRAARAIGNAVHVNPWPIVVPCHRVVASNGIGGYGGGIAVKEFLLDLEARHRED